MKEPLFGYAAQLVHGIRFLGFCKFGSAACVVFVGLPLRACLCVRTAASRPRGISVTQVVQWPDAAGQHSFMGPGRII